MEWMKYPKKNQQAFTLVEVAASLTIISIILLGAYQLMISTNETAVYNNQRLVAINLGKSTMDRVKMEPFSYFNPPDENVNLNEDEYEYTDVNCEPENCQGLYNAIINDKEYSITLTVSQDDDEKRLKLINVLVDVELSEGNISHQVEGYVDYAT